MFEKPSSDLIPTLDVPPQVEEIKPLEDEDIPVEMEINDVVETSSKEVLPEVEPKTILNQEDIFINKARPKTPVRSRSPEKLISGGTATSPLKEKPQLTKSGRKKRKPMTEEQKAKLAEARKKAMAVRKANKAKRDE